MRTLYIVLLIILLAGCGPSSEQMTATAVMAKAQTQTAAPTLTSTITPTSTSTPKPTVTPEPTITPTPRPAAVGETVQYGNLTLEITVLEAGTHTQLMFGWSGWDANEGYIFVDMAVLLRSKGNSAVVVRTWDLYVAEENGDAWNPQFGGSQTVDFEKPFKPMNNIKIVKLYGDESFLVERKKDTYLRLVFVVHEHQNILFGVQGSSQFVIPVD
jgi:hypothetical protein